MGFEPNSTELKEKVIHIGRVSKTVKGGRNFRFAALVIVGDENGHVGKGLGKAAEIPDAIRKGIEDAKKNMISVPLDGNTIPHEAFGVFGAGKIVMYADKKTFSDFLVEDKQIRDFVKKECFAAGVSNIEIERKGADKTSIIINAAKPGIIIGRQGAGIEDFKKR